MERPRPDIITGQIPSSLPEIPEGIDHHQQITADQDKPGSRQPFRPPGVIGGQIKDQATFEQFPFDLLETVGRINSPDQGDE